MKDYLIVLNYFLVYRHILYVAESPKQSLADYLFLGTFGETPKATRPIVIIYDIETLTFKALETIPEHYSAGQIIWKPDSSGIIGVAWGNHPFPMGCPGCANRQSQVFSADLIKTSDLVHDHFLLLSPIERHAISPRLIGDYIVYFDNSLSTYPYEYLVPGPQDKSRHLMRFNLNDAMEKAKEAAHEGRLGLNLDDIEMLIDVHQTTTLPDGTTFYGLYPKLPLPENVFSHNHEVMYLTIYQAGSLRAASIDLNTAQITIHPEPDLTVMEVTEDFVVVQKSSLDQKPYLAMILIESHIQTSTTTTTTTTTTTGTQKFFLSIFYASFHFTFF